MRKLAAVVLCRGLRRELFALVDMLRRQDAGEMRIVLVEAAEIDDMSRRVVASLAAEPDVERVEAPPSGSAALRNAAVEAARAETVFFLEPECRLEPPYCRRALAAFAAEPEPDFVTSGEVFGSPACDLTTLLGQPDAIHSATLFRRRLWETLGGFDEGLEELEMFDFWLRALDGGARGVVLEEALVRRAASAASRSRLRRERHLPALTAVFRKHRALFERHPAAVLVPRERRLYELSERRRSLLERRTRAAGEVDRLNREIRELTDFLRQHGRDRVEWGDLRRTTPISPEWGTDRGKAVDRRYIEEFLAAHAADVRGAVLEVQEGDYTRDYGGERVVDGDVLDVRADNPRATIVADLRQADAIPSESYDCFILTQTLHVVDDMRAALAECVRVLKPGGVLLMTFPCVSRVCLEYGDDGDFWRLTEAGARRLVYELFPVEQVETRAYGNVMTAAAFLYGLACDELSDEELAAYDPFHPVLVGVRAVKPGAPAAGAPAVRPSPPPAGVILAYHRIASCSQDVHSMCVPAPQFREQMEHLERHYRPLDLGELAARAAAGDLPPGAVAVTFDDGYVDALTTASPILSELGIPATFFISTEHLDGERELWWDTLERIFFETDALPDRLELRLHGETLRFETAGAGQREAAHGRLYQAILKCPPAQRDEALRQLGRWSGVSLLPSSDRCPMIADEVRRLAARDGHAIGAHGVHHLALSHQPFETQQREVMECKTALERLLGRGVTAFAYPYGDVCDQAVDLVRAASFRLAVTCEEKHVGPRIDLLRLPRRTVPSGPPERFAAWLKEASRPAGS